MAVSTPWGTGQYVEKVARGIAFIGTAGHGGYRVSNGKLDKACASKGFAVKYTRKDKDYTWFEEDCEWAFVAILFPENFKPEHIDDARRIINNYWPDLYTYNNLERRGKIN